MPMGSSPAPQTITTTFFVQKGTNGHTLSLRMKEKENILGCAIFQVHFVQENAIHLRRMRVA